MLRDRDKRIYEILTVFGLILTATVIRNVYLLQYEVRLPYYRLPIIDSAYYDAWAIRVANGEGYGPMPFYMAPLYPYMLALVYKVFQHNLTIVYFLQEMLGVLNVFLVYLLGRRLFGHVAGLIAGLMITLYAPVVYLESKLLTETLAITLSLGSLLMLMRAIDKPTIVRFMLTGMMLGLSALCRPTALLTAVLMALWLLWRKPVKGRLVAVLAAGIALAVLPVTARNYFVGKDFALITTNVGVCLFQADNPSATGVFTSVPMFSGALEMQQMEEMEFASRALGHQVTASESSGFLMRLGLRFIRKYPARFALLTLKKLVWSLHKRESACAYGVDFEKTFVPMLGWMFIPFSLLAGLGLFGIVRARGPKESELLMIQAASIYISMIIFYVSSRFRAPAMPALAVFAGCAVVHIARKPGWKSVVGPAVCLAGILAISLIPYPQPLIRPNDLGNVGTAYVKLGDIDKGVFYLRKALAMDPSAMAHYNLGTALLMEDKVNDAVAHLRKAVELAPNFPKFQEALAMALLRQEKLSGPHH